MKFPLKNIIPFIPEIGSPADFAHKRSFYWHPGIDLWCESNVEVQAIEDGTVVHIENFTGCDANPPSPWWNETWSILVEGSSGVIGYCELKPLPHIVVGSKIKEGNVIANIIPVLKQNKGNGLSMLHLELYVPGTKHHVTWYHDEDQPKELLNPRQLLEQIIVNNSI